LKIESCQAATSGRLSSLPVFILYLTDRCNSRCGSCDYWRHGKTDIGLEDVQRLIPDLFRMGTRTVVISGGEPLQHPCWREIASSLREAGLKLWLITSGISLLNKVDEAATLFETITVSLDGADRETYRAIRGVDAFHRVCAGIRAAVAQGATVSIRCTIQRANYHQFPRVVSLAVLLGVRQISFLAVDVHTQDAFGRVGAFDRNLGLQPDDLPRFSEILDTLERDFSREFQTGFIAETPQKLRRLHQYFAAAGGAVAYPAVRCNAPEFSAVIEANGDIRPCYFIPGPQEANVKNGLAHALNTQNFVTLRQDIRERRRPECEKCVCSKWWNQNDGLSGAL
jgi:radical SAM protein with 4Fe4S-binding SPASM domain